MIDRRIRRDAERGFRRSMAEEKQKRSGKIALAGREASKPVAIFRGTKRQQVMSQIMDTMRDWRWSKFEFEGPCFNYLRQDLAGQGYGWLRSEFEAGALVSDALKVLGAERPTWEQGQRYYSNSLDFCCWCNGPVDEGGRSRGHRFCSTDCARLALKNFDRKSNRYTGIVINQAGNQVREAESPPKPCEYCGELFQNRRKDARFCSIKCVTRWSKGDRLLKNIVCEGCGETCRPHDRKSTFCSKSCATVVRWRKEREALAGERRRCRECNAVFTPTKAVAIYCSRQCAARAGSRAAQQRAGKAGYRVFCRYCQEPFMATSTTQKFCSVEHRNEANRLSKPWRHPQPITASAFDFVFRIAA